MNPMTNKTDKELADKPVNRCACDGICKDHDDECVFVTDVLACYLYQPERGICPLLAGGKNWQPNSRTGRLRGEMKVIDKGHKYELLTLDGELRQELRFVKRHDPVRPWRFPGNTESYPGTTLQSVIRALLERMRYLQNQIWSAENSLIISMLRFSLWLLEFRAARRHKRFYWFGWDYAESAAMCRICGHTVCKHWGRHIPLMFQPYKSLAF
jgi:hypothetical protein